MNSTVIFVNVFASSCLIVAFIKDRKKTKQSLIMAIKSIFRILPIILIMIILIGLLLGFLQSGLITRIIGKQSGFSGVFFAALFGTIMHIPALISFPLAASLLKSGASITAVAAFVTTLTMVGTIMLPLEIKELGKEITLFRNGISFIIAIIIALIMGVIL